MYLLAGQVSLGGLCPCLHGLHVQVGHHGRQPLPLLGQLNLQLTDHLQLDAGLGSAAVIQGMLQTQVPTIRRR